MPNALSPYQIRAIKDGYRYECPCGELLNSISAAANCSKCWDYAPDMAGMFVVDIKTDEVVFGSIPTEEESDHREAIADLAHALSIGKFKPMPISSAP